MKSSFWILFGTACLIASSTVNAEGDPAAGRDKSFTCTGCHSIPGQRNAYPAYPIPKLGGQNAQYLEAALRAYRDGMRQHPTMHAQTAQFTDQDIQNVAAYYSQLIPAND